MSGSRGRPATGAAAERPGSRPASKGSFLAVNGTAPPSRNGPVTPPGTTSRARTSRGPDAPTSALAAKLILKMRVRFGDAAADLMGQEIISQMVMDYLSKAGAGTIKEEDVTEIESRIRAKLTGGTPRKMTMTMEKKAQVEGDEWAKMFQYNIQQGLAKDRSEAEAARQQQLKLKEVLDGQIRILEERKRVEHEEEQAYFQAEQASLREAEAREEMRRELQASIMRKLGQERQEQLREKEERVQRAIQRVKDDEAELAARIAYETRYELEKEEQERTVAKSELKVFLSANEINKRLREEARQKQFVEDAHYKKQWEEKLNKQEADRLRQLEKTKIRQDKQAEAAAKRPEAKQWLDQELIDRHYREREEARDREEVERVQRVRAGGRAAAQTLAVQMKEREEQRAYEKSLDQDAARMVLNRAKLEEEKEQEKQRRAQESKLRFKAELEAQMKDNAHRRRVAPMTEIERKINTKLLEQVHDWQATGRITT